LFQRNQTKTTSRVAGQARLDQPVQADEVAEQLDQGKAVEGAGEGDEDGMKMKMRGM